MMSVYEYFDYRKLLKDLFEEQKAQNRFFSYRTLAGMVGFTSSGFFTKILQGAVNISPQKAIAFAKAFHLTKLETRYFEKLVAFNQARTHEERRFYLEQLVTLRQNKLKTLTSKEYELFSEWYFVVIREILEFYPFNGNYKELGNMLQPAIAATDARKAIDTLEDLKLIRRKADGYYERTGELINTSDSLMNVAITNFQINSSELAKDAIQNVPKEAREISTLTLSISQSTYEEIRNRLRDLRRELLELAQKETLPDRVYQVNMQLFPVTKPYNRSIGAGELLVKGKRGRKPLGLKNVPENMKMALQE